MKKLEVLEFFEGYKGAAQALDVTDSAVRMMPEDLSSGAAAKVLAAAIKTKGVRATKTAFPSMFERAAS